MHMATKPSRPKILTKNSVSDLNSLYNHVYGHRILLSQNLILFLPKFQTIPTLNNTFPSDRHHKECATRATTPAIVQPTHNQSEPWYDHPRPLHTNLPPRQSPTMPRGHSYLLSKSDEARLRKIDTKHPCIRQSIATKIALATIIKEIPQPSDGRNILITKYH